MKPREFVIDCDAWVTADTPIRGDSQLLNSEGYMCCLGQVAEQCGIGKEFLVGVEVPRGLMTTKHVELLAARDEDTVSGFTDTRLSVRAMTINDGTAYPGAARIDALIELFAENDIKLTFKHADKYIEDIEASKVDRDL